LGKKNEPAIGEGTKEEGPSTDRVMVGSKGGAGCKSSLYTEKSVTPKSRVGGEKRLKRNDRPPADQAGRKKKYEMKFPKGWLGTS